MPGDAFLSAGAGSGMTLGKGCRREASLERALIRAFWHAVQNEPMPVMAALEAAARALGTLYRETAAAHGPGGSCGCGWQPDPEADLIVLEAMLAAAAAQETPAKAVADLANMPAKGQA